RPPAQLPWVLTNRHTEADIFHQDLRIDPVTFKALLHNLEDDPIFISRGPNPQMPVECQLAITLYRFGHFGNAASISKVSQWAGCAKGMVVNATRCVMTAVLHPNFRRQCVHFPTAQVKEEAKSWVRKRTCMAWGEGWAFVDGTLVPLYACPNWYPKSSFDRKQNYSLNLQVCSVILLCVPSDV
ncbi:hypothetical protein BKA70DRAFT_1123953, partial [Coprinopsis sp. MPI-PUGE-AT-0042]